MKGKREKLGRKRLGEGVKRGVIRGCGACGLPREIEGLDKLPVNKKEMKENFCVGGGDVYREGQLGVTSAVYCTRA